MSLSALSRRWRNFHWGSAKEILTPGRNPRTVENDTFRQIGTVSTNSTSMRRTMLFAGGFDD
jgi:hypothetical protein